MYRIVAFLALTAAGALVVVPPAYGDAVYHSQHITVTAVGDAPLRSGFVENVHANGPVVFAHEIYVLNGAQPDATYQVTLDIYVGSPTCQGSPFPVQSAQLSTNAVGNGRSDAKFTPADAAPLRHQTHGIVWTFAKDGTVVYSSACEQVTID